MKHARSEPLNRLGDLEAAVLETLWTGGEMSTPDVHGAVGVPRGLAYTTVLTVLQRLAQKGLLRRRDGVRSHLYSPTLTREEFAERRAETIASAFVEIGAAGLGAFLAETERLDPEIVNLLRKRLRNRR